MRFAVGFTLNPKATSACQVGAPGRSSAREAQRRDLEREQRDRDALAGELDWASRALEQVDCVRPAGGKPRRRVVAVRTPRAS